MFTSTKGGEHQEHSPYHEKSSELCELAPVCIQEDWVRNILERVVEDLPYGLLTWVAFLRKHGSILTIIADSGGFKPAATSPWVSFLSSPRARRRRNRRR